MKLLSRISFCLCVVVLCTFLLFCCNKQSFKDGVGLYSQKQYHCYTISSPGDTTQLANAIIGISEMSNNYLSWNAITFHLNSSTDTLVTYINDTSVSGTYEILYNLNYYPKTDEVVVIGNYIDRIWRSY